MFFILILILTIYSLQSYADSVFLSDDSIITGVIQSNYVEDIEVKTKYLGIIKIFKKDISKVEITEDNEALRDALEADKKFFNSNMIVWKHEKSVTGENRVLVAEEDKKDNWQYRFDFFGNHKSGSKSSHWLSGTFEVKHEFDDLRINSYFYAENEQSRGNTVKENAKYVLDIEVEKDISTRYSKTEVKYDRIREIEYSVTESLGFGYYFYKEANFELRIRLGVYATVERFYEEAKDYPSGLEFGFYSFYTFENQWKFVTDTTLKESFHDKSSYSGSTESYLEVPLYSDKLWSLRLGVKYSYENVVADGVDPVDSEYYVRLNLGWFDI
jgi:hypothetical protein